MKAWRLNSIGDIGFLSVDKPVINPGEVLIRVMAAGICGSDIPRIFKTGAHKMPLIPGHEFSGIVEETGRDVPDLWTGKRVGIFPLIPCRACGPCKAGHPEMCRNYDYIGSRRDGAFAEYVTVPAENLIELPDEVSFEEGAMLEPMAVAAHAMHLALNGCGTPLCRDAKLVVCGLGTIGLLLVMFLLDQGFENVYVIGNRPEQKKRALSLGIREENWCNSREDDALKWITGTVSGADAFFECVGRNECISLGIDAAAPGGRILLVGNPYSDMSFPKDTYWKILRNQLTLKGTWNSTFLSGDNAEDARDDWQFVMQRLLEGSICPERLITHRLKLEEMDRGFHIMKDKTEDCCKIMMIHNRLKGE